MVKIRYSQGLPFRPREMSGDPVGADAQPRVKTRATVLGGFTLIVVIAAFTAFVVTRFVSAPWTARSSISKIR